MKRLRQRPFNGVAFPILGGMTKQEALDVQVATCSLVRVPHDEMKPGTPWYKLASGPFPFGFSGELEDVRKVTDHLKEVLASIRAARE